MQQAIQKLMDLITATLPMDVDHYPPLEKKSDKAKMRFGIKHFALHLMKTIGEYATLIEPYDHGEQVSDQDRFSVRRLVRKLVVDSLRLASFFGISAEDIIEDIQEWSEKEQAKRQQKSHP